MDKGVGKGGGGEEAEPVTEAGQRQRDPQPAERLDREDAADLGLTWWRGGYLAEVADVRPVAE
jgi:hypothetical protein